MPTTRRHPRADEAEPRPLSKHINAQSTCNGLGIKDPDRCWRCKENLNNKNCEQPWKEENYFSKQRHRNRIHFSTWMQLEKLNVRGSPYTTTEIIVDNPKTKRRRKSSTAGVGRGSRTNPASESQSTDSPATTPPSPETSPGKFHVVPPKGKPPPANMNKKKKKKKKVSSQRPANGNAPPLPQREPPARENAPPAHENAPPAHVNAPPTNESVSPPSPPTLMLHYWQSTEAKKLFAVKEDETVFEAIDKQMALLRAANESSKGYKEVISGRDDDNLLSESQILKIRQKSQYLHSALRIAKAYMNKWSWSRCCSEAIKIADHVGLSACNNPITLQMWYRDFREGRCFQSMDPPRHDLPSSPEHESTEAQSPIIA